MNIGFPRMLCCPDCGSDFAVEVFLADDEDVEEGTLTCGGCGRVAPVIGGVPRFLAPYLNRAMLERYPDYFSRHDVKVPVRAPSNPFEKMNQAIFDAFNYNWVAPLSIIRRVSKAKPKLIPSVDTHPEDRRVFLDNVAPLEGDFFKGKLGLDAGCNVGRGLWMARENGAEMVGLEQTFAVERARQLTRGRDGVHLIQGSLFELPFKNDLFDLALCFGVLHHTPDPQGAFRGITSTVKPAGVFLTMTYGLDEMALWYRLSHMRALRLLTTRIPLTVTRKVCEALAVSIKYGVILPLSALSAIPGIGSAARRFPFMYLRKDPAVAISRNFFDRLAPPVSTFHTRSEIEGWYRDAGFSDVRIARRDVNAWRGYGVRGS